MEKVEPKQSNVWQYLSPVALCQDVLRWQEFFIHLSCYRKGNLQYNNVMVN